MISAADAHFLIWKIHQELKRLEGFRWKVAGNLYREGLQIEVTWKRDEEARRHACNLDFRSHHPIDRDEYVDWLVQALIGHIEQGIEAPSIDGELGFELRSHDGPRVTPLIDLTPWDAEGLHGGAPETSSDEVDEPDGGEDDGRQEKVSHISPDFEVGRSHELYTVYGYTVARKARLSAESRRRILSEAVDDRGPDWVYRHLHGLISRNSRGRARLWFHAALKKWGADLAWLSQNYVIEGLG